jgi:hypothetical protein
MVFMGFSTASIKQRNVTDSSTACRSRTLLAAQSGPLGFWPPKLAVDLLLIYYLHRAQLGVTGDAVQRVSHLGDKG